MIITSLKRKRNTRIKAKTKPKYVHKFYFFSENVSPFQLPEPGDGDHVVDLHLRLHQELLARGAGQEQDRADGDILETCADR